MRGPGVWRNGRQITILSFHTHCHTTSQLSLGDTTYSLPTLMSPGKGQNEELGLGGKRNMLSLLCPQIAGTPGRWPCWLGLISRHLCFLLVPPRLATLAEPYAGPSTPVFLGQDHRLRNASLYYCIVYLGTSAMRGVGSERREGCILPSKSG